MTAWLVAAYLTKGQPQATAFVRSGIATGEFLPGLSDIDLFVVCHPDPGDPGSAARRVHERHRRLAAGSRAAELLVDRPLVLESDELHDVIGANTLTYGLPETGHRGPGVTVYHDGASRDDLVRMTEVPGLYRATATWRHLRGRRLRITEPHRSLEATRLAAWLDLIFWWRLAFTACRGNFGPRGGYTERQVDRRAGPHLASPDTR